MAVEAENHHSSPIGEGGNSRTSSLLLEHLPENSKSGAKNGRTLEGTGLWPQRTIFLLLAFPQYISPFSSSRPKALGTHNRCVCVASPTTAFTIWPTCCSPRARICPKPQHYSSLIQCHTIYTTQVRGANSWRLSCASFLSSSTVLSLKSRGCTSSGNYVVLPTVGIRINDWSFGMVKYIRLKFLDGHIG